MHGELFCASVEFHFSQVYCCETCQPLRLPAATAAATAAAAAAAPSSKGRSRSKPAAAATAAAAAAAGAVAAQLLHPSRLKSMAAAKVAQVRIKLVQNMLAVFIIFCVCDFASNTNVAQVDVVCSGNSMFPWVACKLASAVCSSAQSRIVFL
jgi:hypothetical protein